MWDSNTSCGIVIEREKKYPVKSPNLRHFLAHSQNRGLREHQSRASWLCTDSSPTRDREAGGGSQSLKGAISAPERHPLQNCIYNKNAKGKKYLLRQGLFAIISHLYWGLVALQWIGFCCVMKQISYMYTYSPSLLDLPPTPTPVHPFKSSQSTELISLCCFTWKCRLPHSILAFLRDSLDSKQRVEEDCVGQVLEVHHCIYLKNVVKILNILLHNAFFTIWLLYRDLCLWDRKIKEHFALFVLMDLWILSLLFFFFLLLLCVNFQEAKVNFTTHIQQVQEKLTEKGNTIYRWLYELGWL